MEIFKLKEPDEHLNCVKLCVRGYEAIDKSHTNLIKFTETFFVCSSQKLSKHGKIMFEML